MLVVNMYGIGKVLDSLMKELGFESISADIRPHLRSSSAAFIMPGFLY